MTYRIGVNPADQQMLLQKATDIIMDEHFTIVRALIKLTEQRLDEVTDKAFKKICIENAAEQAMEFLVSSYNNKSLVFDKKGNK